MGAKLKGTLGIKAVHQTLGTLAKKKRSISVMYSRQINKPVL